jgi:hypothetical protein
MGTRRRFAIAVAGCFLLGLMVWPATVGRDSFPLSNYPMFASDRPAQASFRTVVGVDASGSPVRLSPADIGGTDQVIQAAATVGRAIADGEADQLCAEVADRVGADVVAVEVVTERYDTIAWFDGHETPAERVVHARCDP